MMFPVGAFKLIEDTVKYLRVLILNAFKCFNSVRPYVIEPCSSH